MRVSTSFLMNRRWCYNWYEFHVHNIYITKLWAISSYFIYLHGFIFTLFSSRTEHFSMFFHVSNLILTFQTDWVESSTQYILVILLRYATIFGVFFLGRFDFERISKSVLRLLRTARTKLQTRIYVQHQYAWSVVVQRLCYSEGSTQYILVILLRSAAIFWGFLAGEIWFWANFKTSFTLAQHSQDKTANQDFCSTPIWLKRCGSETVL